MAKRAVLSQQTARGLRKLAAATGGVWIEATALSVKAGSAPALVQLAQEAERLYKHVKGVLDG
jgi:hypothetical protein